MTPSQPTTRPARRPVRLPARFPSRAALFTFGAFVIGTGISGIITADLGVAPYDSVNTGIAHHLNLPVGTASWITATLCVLLAWLLGRRPHAGTFVSAILSGLALNTALTLVPAPVGLPTQLTYLTVGFLGLCLGISMVVVARLGAGAPEELMLARVGKGVPLYAARWGLEALLLTVGFLLGGSIGFATVGIVVLTGPVLAVLIPAVSRITRLPLDGQTGK